jgi:hypothetical protein
MQAIERPERARAAHGGWFAVFLAMQAAALHQSALETAVDIRVGGLSG